MLFESCRSSRQLLFRSSETYAPCNRCPIGWFAGTWRTWEKTWEKMGDLKSQMFFLSLVWNDESFGDAVKAVSLKIAAVRIRESPVPLGWAQKLRCPSASGRIDKFESSCPSNNTWRVPDAGHFNNNSSSSSELRSINWNCESASRRTRNWCWTVEKRFVKISQSQVINHRLHDFIRTIEVHWSSRASSTRPVDRPGTRQVARNFETQQTQKLPRLNH